MPASTGKPSYGYGRGHRAAEIVSLFLFFAAQAVLGHRISDAVDSLAEGAGVAAAVLGGYVLADFMSGVVHWAADTVGDETTPMLGSNFIKPFREHHADPKAITRHDFIETNGNSSIISVPVLAVLVAAMPSEPGVGFYLGVVAASCALFVFFTNQFHKWAHSDAVPRPVAWLQRAGLILGPAHHQIHHAAPHDTHYCITTGWLNPLLGRLRFFRLCEAVVGWARPTWLTVAARQRVGRG